MIYIDGNNLTIEDVINVAYNGCKVALSEKAKRNINDARKYVEKIIKEERVVYGITTGFGKFSDVSISKEQSELLQKNLIISHACGVGNHFNKDVVKTIMLLRANALSKGYSGIHLETLEVLIEMINKNVIPAIPEKGSLGASGDLAPLAHMVLPLIGLGEAYYNGALLSGDEAMKKAGITPVKLTSKEGLALINGTQVMTAVGLLTAYKAMQSAKLSDIISAMSMEATNGIADVFMSELHSIRPHIGQMNTARNMERILKGSECVTKQAEIRVQDAYVFRCIPQVHGASKDTINYVLDKVNIEINSVTDNPIILLDKDVAISGGNFHGQPVALPFDFLGIGIAEMANISERRIERLVNPQLSGLPAFLIENGGLNSGFMIAQYSAASLVSENKVLAHPASVDSIPSSANQEDHVSMGTIAARKARDIYFNTSRVLAVELLCAAQGLDLNERNIGKKLGAGTKIAYDILRSKIEKMTADRVMYKEIEVAAEIVECNIIVDEVESEIGELDF